MATPERVVIAAAGVVTSIGQDLEAFWSSLGAGADAAAPAGAAPEGPRTEGGGRRGGSARRSRGPRLREVAAAGPRGGLWAHVPADEPLPFLPREVESVDLSELDLDGADADWFEANPARRAILAARRSA